MNLKKLFSIFSIFLAFGHVVTEVTPVTLPTCYSVTGETTFTCEITNGDSLPENNYCIKNDVIYKGVSGASGSCTKEYGNKNIDEGLFVFDIHSTATVATLFTPSDTATISEGGKLVLYDCGYGKCVQTVGYVKSGESIYQCDTTGHTANTAITECTVENFGKVTSDFKICVMEDITINESNEGVPTLTNTLVSIKDTNYYNIKPEATPTEGKFVSSSNNINNIALLKTSENIVALAFVSPQLPQCNTSCILSGTSNKIANNEVCITSEGVIYKMVSSTCTKVYGMTNGTGVKVFQKGESYNNYKDVTGSLDDISKNTDELTPYFVIYDCSQSECTQTSGFVKYKSSTETSYSFMNCFTSIDGSYAIGNVKLNEDKTVDTYNGCTEAKAKSGTYKYKDFKNGVSIFKMCFSPLIETGASERKRENESIYKYLTMYLKENEQNYFLFTNDATQFPNTQSEDKVLVKINSFSGVIEKNPSVGFYKNSASVYIPSDEDFNDNEGKDALITITSENNIDYTFDLIDVSDGESTYYLNSGVNKSNYPLIHCVNKKCETIKPLNGYYLNSDSNENAKHFIICNNNVCSEDGTEYSSDCTKIGIITSSAPQELEERRKREGETYNICLTKKTEQADGEVVQIPDDTTIVYKTITISSKDDFPGAAASSTIDIKIAKDSVTILETSSLPVCDTISNTDYCKSSNVQVNYCIKDKKIYKTTGSSCSLLSGTAKSEVFYFTQSTNEKLPILFENDSDVMAYQCTYTLSETTNTQSTCELIKGYIIVGTRYINCNGWKGDGCTIEGPSSPSQSGSDRKREENGEDLVGVIVEGKLIIGSKEIEIPTDSTTKLLAFKSEDVNSIYGVRAGIIFLSVSSKKVTISSPTDTTDKYYYNQLATTDNEIIYYSNSKWITGKFTNTLEHETASQYVYIDAGDPSKKTIICYQVEEQNELPEERRKRQIIERENEEDVNFKSVDLSEDLESNNLYFIYEKDNSKIVVCSKSDGCKLESGKIGYAYIDGSDSENKHIITCTTSNNKIVCSSIDGSHNDYKGNYIDGVSTKNVIICDSSCSSNLGSTRQGHAYIDKAKAGNIITCNSVSCSSAVGITTDDNVYIDAKDITKLISCTTGSCSEKTTSANTIYIDATDNTKSVTKFGSNWISVKSLTVCSSTENTGLCKYSGTQQLPSERYCITGENKIFNSPTTICTQLTPNEATVYIFEIENNTYKMGTFGSTTEGIIYSCTNSNVCTQMISTHYLYGTSNKYLYDCNDFGVCVIINTISEGYYLSGDPTITLNNPTTNKELIYCEDTDIKHCVSKTILEADIGYYIDANNSSNLIYCSNANVCSSLKVENNKGAIAYLDANDEDAKSVIICDGKSCISKEVCSALSDDDSEKIYFVDGGVNDNIITCKNSGCSSDIGNTYYISAIDPNYTITCIAVENNEIEERRKREEISEPSGCTITKECKVNTGSNCEDDKYYIVKPNEDGNAPNDNFILETEDEGNGYLYYCKNNVVTGKISCSRVDAFGIFFNNDKEIYTCKTDTTPDPDDIKCGKSSTIGETCYNEGDTGLLYLDNNGKLAYCIDESSNISVVLSNESKYYLQPTFENNIFEIEANGLLSITKNSISIALNYSYTLNYYIYVDRITKEILTPGKCPANPIDPFCSPYIEEYECTQSTGECNTTTIEEVEEIVNQEP